MKFFELNLSALSDVIEILDNFVGFKFGLTFYVVGWWLALLFCLKIGKLLTMSLFLASVRLSVVIDLTVTAWEKSGFNVTSINRRRMLRSFDFC